MYATTKDAFGKGEYGGIPTLQPPDTEIQEAMKNLDRDIMACGETFGMLLARLQPVLREDRPRSETSAKQGDSIAKCRLAEDIDSASRRVRDMALNIQGALERIGL